MPARRPPAIALALAAALGLVGAPGRASADADVLARALARADQERLPDDPHWRALLHYEKSLVTRRDASHVETDDFFFDPNGRRDPAAELAATLTAFADPDARVRDDQPPRCAFPARFAWLAERLALDPAAWPAPPCDAYTRWREGLRARQLTLIYPEGFMSNPASMFGHTLLRLDVTRAGGVEDLLGYAIDFTGDTGGDPMLVYVAKGIVGMYPGRFGLNPYYTQLERYSEWENRDIWEYRLDFTPEELDFLLMHLWELRGVGFPYYFFDENCSYHLLKLMEVARPEIDLSDGFPLAVIPVDTVRAVSEVPGLVTGIRYRPSPATELRFAERRMPRAQRRLAAEIARAERAPTDAAVEALPVVERAAVLSLAYDRLRYAFLAGQQEATEDTQGRARAILVARSRARPASGRLPDPEPIPAPAVRPEQGHGSAMSALVGGVEDGDGYLELRFRPAFHELVDPQGGYTKAMQISFLDARVRYYPALDRVRLQELVLVEALSYSPRSEVFRPIAWKLDTAIRTRRVATFDRLREETVWRTAAGVGLSTEAPAHTLVYGLGEAVLDVSPSLEDVASFGPAIRVGLLTDWPGDRYRAHLFGTVTRFALGDTDTWIEAGLVQRVSLRRDLTFEVETTFNRTGGRSWGRFAGSLKLFF